MTCDDRRDLLLLYAADPDSLGADEREAVRAHLAGGCPQCAASLAEAQATLAHLPLALDVGPPLPAGVKGRLMERIASGPPVTGWRAFIGPARVAAAVLVAVGLTYWVMRAQVRALRQEVATLRSPDLQMVSLAGQPTQPEHARGRVLWDRSRNLWHVSVFDLKPLPVGKTYELWFITPDQRKVPAGTFDVNRDGHATLVVSVPANLGGVALAAVTDEPAGGVDQPTGAVQLVGAVK